MFILENVFGYESERIKKSKIEKISMKYIKKTQKAKKMKKL
jgi:hypothetical protein